MRADAVLDPRGAVRMRVPGARSPASKGGRAVPRCSEGGGGSKRSCLINKLPGRRGFLQKSEHAGPDYPAGNVAASLRRSSREKLVHDTMALDK